jgi:hypothetical protein
MGLFISHVRAVHRVGDRAVLGAARPFRRDKPVEIHVMQGVRGRAQGARLARYLGAPGARRNGGVKRTGDDDAKDLDQSGLSNGLLRRFQLTAPGCCLEPEAPIHLWNAQHSAMSLAMRPCNVFADTRNRDSLVRQVSVNFNFILRNAEIQRLRPSQCRRQPPHARIMRLAVRHSRGARCVNWPGCPLDPLFADARWGHCHL